MILRLGEDGRPVVEEPADLKRFKVVVEGRPAIEAARARLGPLGEMPDAETAWIGAGALADLVGGDAGWRAGFAAMLEKVKPFGWYDETTGRIKAHVEWVD